MVKCSINQMQTRNSCCCLHCEERKYLFFVAFGFE